MLYILIRILKAALALPLENRKLKTELVLTQLKFKLATYDFNKAYALLTSEEKAQIMEGWQMRESFYWIAHNTLAD